jgi:perosamine synthetase
MNRSDKKIRIPLDSPLLVGNEKNYLNECIDTNWVSWQGRFVNQLENEIANYCGTNFGVSIINGTQALIIALRALGVGPNDEVIVPAFTMSATTFAVSSLGAKIIWADVDDNSLNIGAAQVQEKITKNTKAIIAVHLYGSPCDIESIKLVAGDIPIIEDAAESFGATINSKVVGSMGDISCHSFHNKIIASGEGGAVTLNNEMLFEKIKSLRTPAEDNSFGNDLVLNSRMSNIAAAVALAQLENINLLINNRRRIADIYNEHFNNRVDVKILKEKENCKNVYWRYQIFVDANVRDLLVNRLKNKGIESRSVFKLMNEHPYYQNNVNLKNSKLLSLTGIDIPTSPKMTDQEAEFVARTVLEEIKRI